MWENLERGAVWWVARLAPWLAPVPSAFFVGRAAMRHLDVPWPVAVVMALIIESLGLVAVYTALWLAEWNGTKRKSDPAAPVVLAVVLSGVYLVVTIGLTVVLEVWPAWALVAPALFPILAVVGAVNLVLMARQERREKAVQVERQERKAARQARRSGRRSGGVQNRAQKAISMGSSDNGNRPDLVLANAVRLDKKGERMDRLVEVMLDGPEAGVTAWARALGCSRTTVYAYLDELEAAGRVARDEGQAVVSAELG